MFQFRRFPSCTYLIQCRIPFGGFPHSEISGSMLICSSPKLIAAYHVLHRLLMPRHSPCALFRLTFVETWGKFRQASIAFGSVCLTPSPHRFSSSNSNPLALGFEFVKRTLGAQLSFARRFYFQSTILEKSMLLVLYYSWIMQAHYRISVFLAKIVFLPLQMIFIMSICKTFSLLLPSHNCIIIHNVQFSRCIWVPYF